MSRNFEPLKVSPARFPTEVFAPEYRDKPSRSALYTVLREIIRLVRHLDRRSRPSSR